MDENVKKNVNHPTHYNQEGKKECIVEMEEQFGVIAVYWFCKLNAFKYDYRAGNKEGNSAEQDKAKSDWYKNYAETIQPRVTMDDLMKVVSPWEEQKNG